MTEIKTVTDALNFIHGRTKFKKIPTLKRMRAFLQALGNPQKGLTYLHVTGTNGKGSVVAMTRQMLMGQGLTVGTFTSPFITKFNERIELNGQPISDADLVKYTQRVAKVVDQLDQTLPTGGPTEFEIDTAIMFSYFADVRPDVVILEVGIGGLYDSTNVIEDPVATAIVTVGYDHMRILGNTLAAIAQQKAGIIKEGRPMVVGQLPAEALQVIQQTAQEKHARLYQAGVEFQVKKSNGHAFRSQINYDGLQLHHFKARLGLGGDYQVANAGVAITLVQLFCQHAGLRIDRQALSQALFETSWPGRLEVMNDEPLVILDGAHNLPGIQALCHTIRDDFADRDVYLLVAILADKQYDLMLGELASLPNVHITVTNFAGPGPKRPSADLGKVVKEIKTRYPMQVADNWQIAFAQMARSISSDDVLLVTGSLYFISDVRHLFD
ncbi:folylpolyglutamate synthase/dihydrofolate synthase family protein [Limosilactobacillus sp.]|uniref:bifunctional folylpolyglutamate synthase/dihydrofolate synthase n=1 Tax=Limosilactobacillus sp. TaxID=2773925 RepID=UPI00345EF5D2